ncbi:MAG: dTMP kinase [Thiobacillaceae bacterium]|jgi:dTMP kinase|nr:dTMP kinase [Thiobacillaceae bacterium]
MAGLFITLEGVDGAGKSTHLEWLADQFRDRGRLVRLTREPGGTPLGEKLRALLLGEPMHPDTEVLLMFAARREHLAQVIRPALSAGEVVISDRFTDASFAYQSGGRGIGDARLGILEDWVQEGLQPDLTLLFDVASDVAEARRSAARAPDRFEREQAAFHLRVREAYLRRAAAHPERIRVLDGNRTVEEVRRQIRNFLEDWL